MLVSRYYYYTYAACCSACDNLILGELAEADLGNYVAVSILMPIHNNINAVRGSK
jgi:hypothetical protein